MKKAIFPIEGMKCGGCVKSVKKALDSLKGVKTAEVSLEKKNAEITFDETILTEEEIISAIEDIGFDVVR